MNENEKNLTNPVLAPYIERARTLPKIARCTGGNPFRCILATLCILFDYGYLIDTTDFKTKARLLRSESVIKLDRMTENLWKEILKRMGNT